MRTTPLLLVLALPLAASGCAVTAGAVAGYVLHKEANQTNVLAHVTYDYEEVWDVTKDVLDDLGAADLQVVEAIPREASATYDGADVSVVVTAHDLDRTVIEITAERSGIARPATAQRVLDEIIERLQD